jgi:S-adenosylmethionine:tRNA-ribosyltransferase-isomerase (queuine synthetase)
VLVDSESPQLFTHYKQSSLTLLFMVLHVGYGNFMVLHVVYGNFMVLHVGYGNFMDLSTNVMLSANHCISEFFFPTSQANSVVS